MINLILDAANPINWRHPLNRGLVGWWMCPPGTQGGSTLLDLAWKRHGTLTNMNLATAWVGSQFGMGLSLDGADDSVEASYASKPSEIITYAATIRMTDLATIRTIVGWSSGGGLQFRVEPNGALRFVNQSVAGIGLSSPGAVAAGVYARVVGTYDPLGGTFRFWRNGEAVGSGTNAQTLTAGRTVNFSYRGVGNDERFKGNLVSIAIHEGWLWGDVDAREDYNQFCTGFPDTLRRPRGRSMVTVPAGGGGGATPWLYSRRQPQIIGGGMGF